MTKHKLYTVDADRLGEFEGPVPRQGEIVALHNLGKQGTVKRVVWHVDQDGKSYAEVQLEDLE